MTESLKEKVIAELSSKLPPELARDIVDSYADSLVEFRKGAWAETLWKAGKFVENIFRALYFIARSELIFEVSRMTELRKELEGLPNEEIPESVRILIPRIASSMIYDPRSKRGAVHVKPVNPDYLDSILAVSACDWILAELLRNYHTQDMEKVRSIISSIVTRKVPFVERHGGRSFVTVHMGAESETLLLLLENKSGLDRSSIGKSIGSVYTQGRVTQTLQELIRKRYVVNVDGNYAITGPGESHISQVILDSQ